MIMTVKFNFTKTKSRVFLEKWDRNRAIKIRQDKQGINDKRFNQLMFVIPVSFRKDSQIKLIVIIILRFLKRENIRDTLHKIHKKIWKIRRIYQKNNLIHFWIILALFKIFRILLKFHKKIVKIILIQIWQLRQIFNEIWTEKYKQV